MNVFYQATFFYLGEKITLHYIMFYSNYIMNLIPFHLLEKLDIIVLVIQQHVQRN